MTSPRHGSEVLSRTECLRLLASQSIGRVAVSHNALPAILAVNYRLLGEELVIATGAGSQASTLMEGNVIAFEADDIGRTSGAGWSVQVVGIGRRLDPGETAALGVADVDLRPWIGSHGIQLIRLPTDRASGCRVIAADEPCGS